MSLAFSYLFVFITIFLTVYSQIVIKWQVVAAGVMPAELPDKLWFLARLLLNPWILSGLAAGLLAAVSWMAAMTRLELSHAYPFMSLAFVGVLVLSALVFHEPVNAWKIGGLALISLGIIVGSQG
jgi:multidrug transporter EmrE-like cation transporter